MNLEEMTPYPGLRAYRRDESILFFGREGCVDDMVDRLAATRFLAVLGPSGSGKSSLVRTGLLDALKLGLHPAGSRWRIVDCHPGGRPIYNLAKALLETKGGAVEPAFVDALTHFLRRGPLSVVEWVRAGNLPDNQNILIIVDQFEELFRYGDYAGREQAEAFVALLMESARADARIEIVITMRSEFLGACALIPGLAEQINKGLYLARRMTREECREAIEGPAGVVGFEIEPRLVTRILNDLSGFAPWDNDGQSTQIERLSQQADQLPLMQHALSRLWQLAKRRRGGEIRLTLDDYLAIGELRGALDQHAEEVVAKLSDAAKPLVRPIFRALIAGTNLSDAVRKPLRLAELVAIVNAPREPVMEVLEAFRAPGCSFLRPVPPQPLADSTIIDISHESLIRQWSSLVTWLAEEAQANSIWSRLSDAAERHVRGEGETLSGVDLATALDWWQREKPTDGWAKAHRGDRDKVEKFLNKSRDRAQSARKEKEDRDRRESRRLKSFAAIASVLALLSIGAAGLAWRTNVQLDEKVAELDQSNKLLKNEQAKTDAANKALMETNANLQATLAELDHSNSQLKEQQAQTESANRALAETNANLEAARTEAVAAKNEAEAAQKVAEERAKELQAFIVNQTDVLVATSGVDLATAERSLQDTKALLSRMIDAGANPRGYVLVLAPLGLRAAAIKHERGLFEDAVIEAARARQELTRLTKPEEFTPAEAIEYAATFRLEAQALTSLQRFDQAMAAAQVADRSLEDLAANGTSAAYDERAKTWAVLSTAAQRAGHKVDSLTTALRCVQAGQNLPPERSDSDILALASCHLAAAEHEDSVRAVSDPVKQAHSAIDLTNRIPSARRSLPVRLIASQSLAVLASVDLADGPATEARDDYAQALKLVDFPQIDLDQRPELRRAAISIYNDVARMHLQNNEFESALTVLRQGVAALSGDNWQATLDLAKEADALFTIQLAALEGAERWSTDPEAYAEYAKSAVNLIQTTRFLAQVGQSCAGCELLAMRQGLAALMAEVGGDPDAWYRIVADRMDEIAIRSGDLLDNSADETAKLHARRVWVAMASRQPETAAQTRGGDAAARLARLGDSERRVRQFLARFPDSWAIKRKLGRISHAQATQFLAVGNKTDALRAAEQGAQLFSRDAIQLLVDWYRGGSGPVGKDDAQAAKYEALLGSRSWSTITVRLAADPLWKTPIYSSTQMVTLEDRVAPDDDVVGRIVSQLESINGIKLSSSAVEDLKAVDAVAKNTNESFLDIAIAKFSGDANSSDWIARQLQAALADKSASDLSRVIGTQWPKSGGQGRIRDALAQLLAKVNTPELRQQILDRAKEFQSSDYSEAGGYVSATLLDALISTAPADPAMMAELYAKRADAYVKAGEANAAEIDRMISIIIAPDNASNLNSLAFRWANEDRNISASLELLKRAMANVPDNPHIRGSLGWAYLKAGDLEKAVELLESALRDAPGEAEILAHLADAYMRHGRNAEATAKFTEALQRTTDFALTSFILERQQLLVDGNAVASDITQHAASLLSGTDPRKRLGWSTDEIGIAIRGFDPVAYFTKQHPELGSIHFVTVWNDSLWLFSSAEHRDLFVANPEKYAPTYGGFCAFCVAAGHKLHGNPAAWAVHNDRLYIHQTFGYRESWLENPDGNIKAADAAWPGLITKEVDPDARSAFTNRIQQALDPTN